MIHTPRNLLYSASRELEAAGVPDAMVDASILLSFLTGDSPLHLRLDTDTVLTDETITSFQTLIQKRTERIPLQWLTGTQSFCGQEFAVTPDVLIPRPETALLVERVVALGENKSGFSILDLCCGSGCIAISCKLKLPDAAITASDISVAALTVAKQNAKHFGTDVCCVQGNLLEPFADERYDVIVTNPPYIPTKVCSELQVEVQKEPILALDGGADGLDFYRKISERAGRYLKPCGTILLEIGIDEAQPVASMLQSAGFRSITVTDDLAGIPRMVEGCWHE